MLDLLRLADDLILIGTSLAETSNWLKCIDAPARSAIYATFRALILNRTEQPIPRRAAAGRPEFLRLGLADAALICLAADGVVVLTTDGALCDAIGRAGHDALHFQGEMDRI